LQRHHGDGGAIQMVLGLGHPEPGGEGAAGAGSQPPQHGAQGIGQGERHGEQPAPGDEEGAGEAGFWPPQTEHAEQQDGDGQGSPAPGVGRRPTVAVPQFKGGLAQQLPPAGQVGGERPQNADDHRLAKARGGEAQQIDGVGAIKVGQRLGELPHQSQGQEASQQQPEQGADAGEDHKL